MPFIAYVQACGTLAALCILQHGILMGRVLLTSDNDGSFRLIQFASLLNVAVSAYVAFWSNIPAVVEIPKIGFIIWMVIGLIVGLGLG